MERSSGRFRQLRKSMELLDNFMLSRGNLCGQLNQMFFILAVDRITGIISIKISIYTLLFYNVFTYCIAYVQEQLKGQKLIYTVADSSEIRHLAMTTTKLVLEWTKAITFIITAMFLVLVFGFRQGIQEYTSSITKIVITFIYYALTEKVFIDLLLKVAVKVKIEEFDGMEEILFHTARNAVLLTASAIVAVLLMVYKIYGMILVYFYLNVHLRIKMLQRQGLGPLYKYNSVLKDFRLASPDELRNHDDVCSVCLQPMRRARVTPCQHLFHSICLRRCIQSYSSCPLCKQEFSSVIPERSSS